MSSKYLSSNEPSVTVSTSTAVSNKSENQCHANYSGKCVPIASDVDCAGGSGNGPANVRGPVRVVGSDVYGLDRDRDGWGCECSMLATPHAIGETQTALTGPSPSLGNVALRRFEPDIRGVCRINGSCG